MHIIVRPSASGSKLMEKARNEQGLYRLRKGMARVALEHRVGKSDLRDAHGTKFTYASEMAERHSTKTLNAWAEGRSSAVIGSGNARRTPWPWEEKK